MNFDWFSKLKRKRITPNINNRSFKIIGGKFGKIACTAHKSLYLCRDMSREFRSLLLADKIA